MRVKKEEIRIPRRGTGFLLIWRTRFPVYYAQSGHILMMLAEMGLLKEHMTVLDAGSGPGTD